MEIQYTPANMRTNASLAKIRRSSFLDDKKRGFYFGALLFTAALTGAGCSREIDADTSSSSSSTGSVTPNTLTSSPDLTDGGSGAKSPNPDPESESKSESKSDPSAQSESDPESKSESESESKPEADTTAPESTNTDDDQSSTSDSPDTDTTPPGCKDGAERPCSETEDGKPITFPTGEPVGSYKRGISTCKDEKWGACVGAIAPAAQDSCEPGNDDNCNGKPTDHCNCVVGETAPCGESIGACEQGTMTCKADGSWGECIGAKGPSPERCDGKNIDEDCNGKADLQDPKCECIDQSIERCSLGGQGDCALGLKVCEKGRLSHCKSRFPKQSTEQCGTRRDGRESVLGAATGDENCNGQVDETDWASPRPTGCTLSMMDKDNDGWGAVGQDYAKTTNPTKATWGCFCQNKAPAGWRQARTDTMNRDCGDCVDGGFEVKPDRSIVPQEEPSRCLESLDSETPFDYNCSGKHERDPAQSGVFKCEYIEGRGCVGTGYWGGKVPVFCGQEGPFKTPGHCVEPEDADDSAKSCIEPPHITLFKAARCF